MINCTLFVGLLALFQTVLYTYTVLDQEHLISNVGNAAEINQMSY